MKPELFFDQQRNMLVYNLDDPGRLLPYVEGGLSLNNGYVACPPTLYNLQVAKAVRLPTLEPMRHYDWPIRAPWRARQHQRDMANFMVLHPRSFNLSDMGCVGGETLIDTTHGQLPIAHFAAEGKRIKVRSYVGDRCQFVWIDPPFAKGRDHLYRVQFASGRSIVCTSKHVFLTLRGWVSCASLVAGEQLPVFADDPLPSISELSPSRLQQDALHWKQTIQDYQDRLSSRSYDEQLLSAGGSGLASIPSQDDALTRIHFAPQRDDQDNKYTHSGQPAAVRFSIPHYGAHFDLGEMGYFLSEFSTTLNGGQLHTYVRYRRFPSLLPEVHEDQELQLCIHPNAAWSRSLDSVVSISYERTDVYYDMHVPGSQNYIAHGLCHHNTMKTLATLWAADFIMQQNPGWRCLIVCPLSIMQRVWGDAITNHFLGRRTYTILHGEAGKRCRLLDNPSDFYIVNFDGVGVGAKTNNRGGLELKGLSHELSTRQDVAVVVIDEGRAYSTHTTRRSRVARAVLVPKPYVWLLSGTPTPNGPIDAYGLCRIIRPDYPESFTSFKNRIMYKLGSWKWVPRPGAHAEAYKLLQPSIRFEMRECVDVPPCTEQMRDVELSNEQKEHYRKLKRDCVLQLGDRTITAVHEAALRLKLIQISCGAVYDEHHNISYIDCEPRLNELRDVIEEAHRKIIVFAPLTSVIHMLYATLSKDYSCEIINGATPIKQRDTIFKNFQDTENPQILIADPGSMSHGLDLHAASVVCWYGATDRTELYLQGNRRIDRPGQTIPTTIVQLAATRIEREIYRRTAANQSMQGLILQLAKGID